MALKRKRLEAARLKKNLSQEKLAEDLESDRTTISHWERGVTTPSLYYRGKIAEFFKVDDLDAFLEITEEAEIEPLEIAISSVQSLWHPPGTPAFDFIATSPTRRFWQVAHTDYQTPSEMTAAIQVAIKDMNMTMGGSITRRDALCELASIPMIALGQTHTLQTKRYEEMLRYCTAALEACWELYRGGDPVGTQHAFKCACTYVPILEIIAKDSAQYRKKALDLATRYALLKTHLGRHCANAIEAIRYGQEALGLSKVTGDIILQLSAHTKLGWAYFYDRKYTQAHETMLEGESVLKEYQRMKNLPPLPSAVIGNFNSGYALVQVNNGISSDTALGIATNSEPDKTHVAFMEFTPSSQWLEAAETCCSKGDPAQAMIWLAKRIDLGTLARHPHVPQSEQGRIGALNVLTHSLLQSKKRDMERIIFVWIAAVEGAKVLKSEQRYRDAMNNFEIMRAFWPGEKAIMELTPLTSHW